MYRFGYRRVANKAIGSRIDGAFTGSTVDILRWASCKWGIDQDVVFAQAVRESAWQQSKLGDLTSNFAWCPRSAGVLQGKCAESYGIVQNKWRWEKSAWPGLRSSTAMNVDTAYGIWRACFDGYWRPHPGYHAGDLWGCIGKWYAGNWYSAAAKGYIARVRATVAHRTWTTY